MNFIQTLRKRSELQPGVPALIDRCLSRDRVLTYSGLNRLVDLLSILLREAKLLPGDPGAGTPCAEGLVTEPTSSERPVSCFGVETESGRNRFMRFAAQFDCERRCRLDQRHHLSFSQRHRTPGRAVQARSGCSG